VDGKECTRHAAARSQGEQRVLVVAAVVAGLSGCAWRPFAVDCSPANCERPASALTSTASGNGVMRPGDGRC
jgi:hypothetical protein